MARLKRLDIANEVHLLSLRGNNSQTIFFEPTDYEDFLQFCRSALAEYEVQLHGFCLLPQVAFLLITPLQVGQVSPWVQQVARRFVRAVNKRHGRTGTLFEGRFRSGVLQAHDYLLPAMWTLDQLPVQAGLASNPSAYAYSSAAWFVGTPESHSGLHSHLLRSILTPHPAVWQLGNTPFERESVYSRELEQYGGPPPDWFATLQRGWAVGDAEFLALLQQGSARRVQAGQRGRPRKAAPDADTAAAP